MYEHLTSAVIPPSLEDWKGELFWKAMDPIDSSVLGLILQHKKPKDIELIVSEVTDQICPLMFDRYGGSVILNLCRVCDEQQMTQLVSSLTADPHLLMLVCLNSTGSSAMLCLLEILVRTPKQMSDVISALLPLMPRLVKHEFGSRVIHCLFYIFPEPQTAKETQPILDGIADIFFEMATDRYASFLLRELLQLKVFLLESRPTILAKIIADVHQLSHDRYGCCVVREVINLGMQDVVREIVAQLRGHFALMSIHRDACFVLKALIMEPTEEIAPQIYDEMINSPNFSRLLLDPFGKSVIECAWTYTKKTGRKILPLPVLLRENVWPKKKKSRIHV